jgi:pimeloyl-ACP methyl ester carboxylesterase
MMRSLFLLLHNIHLLLLLEQVKVHSMTKKASDMKKEINGFGKFILDFIETIGVKDKISIVGHSLGGYVAAQVAIDNKERIEKLVLIDSSGLLEKPTLLLEQYLDAAMEIEPILRYEKLEKCIKRYICKLLAVQQFAEMYIGEYIMMCRLQKCHC